MITSCCLALWGLTCAQEEEKRGESHPLDVSAWTHVYAGGRGRLWINSPQQKDAQLCTQFILCEQFSIGNKTAVFRATPPASTDVNAPSESSKKHSYTVRNKGKLSPPVSILLSTCIMNQHLLLLSLFFTLHVDFLISEDKTGASGCVKSNRLSPISPYSTQDV